MSALRALFCLLLVFAAPAAAEERIIRFLSDVAVQEDSSLAVTETIQIVAENDSIKHGIYRDFPTRYGGRHGSRVRVGFTFDSATLDGVPVPGSVEPYGNGVRIKIGDPETFVSVGEHSYQIRYRTTRQLGRFDGYDELYWNATGNGWAFPIDVAEARIRLPKPARWGKRALYTGPEGSTASDAAIVSEAPGDLLVRTTRPLRAYEGLTVAIAFPKGVVAEPTQSGRVLNFLADYGPPAAGLLCLIGICAFYYVAWRRVGRDPRSGTVVPIFTPPDDLTPAAMRYILRMGEDNRAFAAALVNMGVKGHVRMVEEEGGWFSRDKTRLVRQQSATPLAAEEEAALQALCTSGESIVMEQKNHVRFQAANKGLAEVLKARYQGKLFNKNWGWAFAGLALLLGSIWLVAAAVVAASGLAYLDVLVPVGAALTAALLLLYVRRAAAVGQCLLSGVAFAFAALAFFTGGPILLQALQTGWWLPFLLPILAVPLIVSAFFWIDAPTSEGRAVLDSIAGFKQYLSITERDRLDRMQPPEADTPELFERYLPYAVALGVENRWADRFSGVLAAAAAQGQSGMSWYSGSHSPWTDTNSFVDSVGSSLTSTISSASTSPGSKSGSGGGGSSGGGSGGGGGGGW